MSDDWDHYDSDGLPVTPRYSDALRQQARVIAEQVRAKPAKAVVPAGPVRELTSRDVAAYDTYQERQHLRDTARLVRRDEFRIKQIERLRDTNYQGYIDSVWPDVYAKMTGAADEAK
jgi:hypothetical protein